MKGNEMKECKDNQSRKKQTKIKNERSMLLLLI